MTKNTEKGFTLLELLLVLAIGALIIAGSVFVYNAATISRAATATVQLVNAIRSEAQASFGVEGVYTGMDEDFFEDVGLLGAAQTHPLNGTVEVDSVTVGAVDIQYMVTLNGIPGEACVKIGNTITDQGVVSIGDGTNKVDPANPTNTLAQDIAALCDADEVDMEFTFSR